MSLVQATIIQFKSHISKHLNHSKQLYNLLVENEKPKKGRNESLWK